jgi:hypothetical protein
MKTKTQKMDTSCKKCGAEMPPLPPAKKGSIFSDCEFKLTGYLCEKCGHWNDLTKRKGYKK